jgi:DNA polymerase III epsilon subunit-like protein
MNKLEGNILVFDLETTGLPPTRKAPTQSDLNQWPSIIQLSAVLYNTRQNNIKSYLNYYVKTDQIVTEEIERITGITNEDCQEKGRPIHEVIASFYELYTRADYIVAHNYEFDSRVFQAEIMRQPVLPEYMANMFSPRTGSSFPITICTMDRYRSKLIRRRPPTIPCIIPWWIHSSVYESCCS